MPCGFLPTSTRMMFPGSPETSGAFMLGFPVASRTTRTKRFVAAETTKPSSALCLNAIAIGLVMNNRVAADSNWTPLFMLMVRPASTSWSASMTDRKAWTFTVKRKGPLGDEAVLGR